MQCPVDGGQIVKLICELYFCSLCRMPFVLIGDTLYPLLLGEGNSIKMFSLSPELIASIQRMEEEAKIAREIIEIFERIKALTEPRRGIVVLRRSVGACKTNE